jgi:tRNA A22 N-methylase
MVVYDSNFYYELILCKKTNYKVEYSEAECLLGPILLQKKEKLFLQKWKEYLSKVELICTNNDKASTLVKKVTLIKESLCIK